MLFLVPNTKMTGTSDGCCVMTRMYSAAIGKGLVVKSYMHEGNIPGLDHKWLHGLQAVHVASIDLDRSC